MTDYSAQPRGASPSGSAIRLWQAVLDRLRLQTPKATYDTWLAETQGLAVDFEAGTLRVAAPTAYGVAWLEGRMQGLADTTASAVAAREISVRFVLLGSQGEEVVEQPVRKDREPRRSNDPQDAERLRQGLALAVDELEGLDTLHKAVLDRLTRYVDDRGKTWVGQGTLADDLNESVKRVRKALRNLDEWGYLRSIAARYLLAADGKWRQSSNMYTIARWLCRRGLRLLGAVREGMRQVRRAVSWVQAKAQGAGRPGRLKGRKVPAGRFLDRWLGGAQPSGP